MRIFDKFYGKEAKMIMKNLMIAGIIVFVSIAVTSMSGCAKPAEFEVGALNISPSEAVSGETTTVTVGVTNIGGTEGTYTATLKVDGVEVETREVTVAASAKETLTWRITEEAPGTHHVAMDGLSGSFKVLKPAEFEVASLVVPSQPVVATSPATVEVQVENVGEVEGTYTVTLEVNGEEMTQHVVVGAGDTEVISFSISMDRQGTYDIAVDGLSDILEVVPLPMSSAVLMLEDLPEDFVVLTLAELDTTMDDLTEDIEEYGAQAHDYFGFLSSESPATFEMVYGYLFSPMTASGQAKLNMELSEPEQMADEIASELGGVTSVEVLPELSNIGDKSIGVRIQMDADGVTMVMDAVIFRIDDVGVALFVAWFEGFTPVVPTDELANTLESRLAEVLATR